MLDKFRLLFIVNINCPQPAINGTCFLSDNHDKTLRPQAKEEEEAEEGNIIVIHVQAAARTRSSGGYVCISTEDWPSSKAHQLPLDHHNIAKNRGNFAQMSIFLEIIKVQSEVAFAKWIAVECG